MNANRTPISARTYLLLWTTALAVWPVLAADDTKSGTGQAQNPAVPVLNEQTCKHWLDFIRPTEDEVKWRKIGWRTDFWLAIQEAKELQRPILLWTMNGHPMACT